MKKTPKKSFLISIVIMVIYFILITEISNTIISFTRVNFWILGIVFAPAIIVPIAMYRKLEKKERKTWVKKLAVSSLILVSIGISFTHITSVFGWTNAHSEFGWVLLFIWVGTIIWVISLAVAIICILAGIVIYKKISRRGERISYFASPIITFIFLFFFIVLIIWSFTNIIATLQEIIR